MMENILLVVQIVVVVAGLAMMCASLILIKRHDDFQQAMTTSEGKWSIGRLLFIGAVLCFGFAMLVWCFDETILN
ncbi:MAG: hypothetical protein H8E66_23125 [Planctomycetes bacterium]|nr:hypothetical protein [Planctomycetota bacterium]